MDPGSHLWEIKESEPPDCSPSKSQESRTLVLCPLGAQEAEIPTLPSLRPNSPGLSFLLSSQDPESGPSALCLLQTQDARLPASLPQSTSQCPNFKDLNSSRSWGRTGSSHLRHQTMGTPTHVDMPKLHMGPQPMTLSELPWTQQHDLCAPALWRLLVQDVDILVSM